MTELTALFTRASMLWRGAADEAMSRHGVRVVEPPRHSPRPSDGTCRVR
jgi:hypothetical protein